MNVDIKDCCTAKVIYSLKKRWWKRNKSSIYGAIFSFPSLYRHTWPNNWIHKLERVLYLDSCRKGSHESTLLWWVNMKNMRSIVTLTPLLTLPLCRFMLKRETGGINLQVLKWGEIIWNLGKSCWNTVHWLLSTFVHWIVGHSSCIIQMNID